MTVCGAAAFAPTADFGGVYQLNGTTCAVGNPMAGGACACPSGSQAIELLSDGSCWEDETLGLCWNGSAPLTAFGGAYEESDESSQGTNGCIVPNPAAGNACACPAGTTAIQIRDVYGLGDHNCKSTGAIAGYLYVCAAS